MDPFNTSMKDSRSKRGRPRQDGDDVGDLIKIRREKNRKAQQTFKARRLAAQAENENRIAHLEQTIESMGDLFLNMTDKVMGFASVREQFGLAQHLQASILQCLSLLRGTIGEPTTSKDSYMDPSIIGQTQESLHSTAMSPLVQPFLNNGGRQEHMQALAKFPEPALREHSIPNESPDFNVFGAGWMNEPPHLYTPPYSIHLHANLQQEVVSVELVRCTLNFSYDVLQGAMDVSSGLAASMFGISLQSHSRDQILSRLVWILGPGSSAMKKLAIADPKALLKAKSSKPPPVVFSTAVPTNEGSLVNAGDIIQWLASIGVRRINEDILEVPMSNWDGLDRATPVSQYSPGQYSFLKADLFFPPTQGDIAKENAEFLTILRVDSIQISQTALFLYLSKISVCLWSGIAYQRRHLAKVIMASRVR